VYGLRTKKPLKTLKPFLRTLKNLKKNKKTFFKHSFSSPGYGGEGSGKGKFEVWSERASEGMMDDG